MGKNVSQQLIGTHLVEARSLSGFHATHPG